MAYEDVLIRDVPGVRRDGTSGPKQNQPDRRTATLPLHNISSWGESRTAPEGTDSDRP